MKPNQPNRHSERSAAESRNLFFNRPLKVLCVILALILITAGCQKKPSKSLQQAAADGDIEQIKLHISQGTDVNAKTNKGFTPIYVAIAKGHKQAVELLIASGADVNAKTEDGWTPLHTAAFKGHADLAELLLANGADVNVKDKDGRSPLGLAKDKGHKEIVELLRKHEAKE